MWNAVREIQDPAQNVSKFVFTKDTAVAEAVLYRYPDYATRTVICCSTMSGCPMGCRFCGAGDFFARSLSADEIVAQVEHCIAQTGIAAAEMQRLQVMFMSMGEPLLNLAGLIPAIERLYAMYPKAALLISTSAPDIGKSFAEVIDVSIRVPTVGLQFSVHESTDEARDKLIPFQRKLGLWDIGIKGAEWARATGRRPFFNYCAHDGNSGDIDADRLERLFSPTIWNATVSVVCERSEGLPATNDHQRELATSFGDKLLARGFDVRVFDPAGQDTIGGGCGQLWFVQDWASQHPEHAKHSIGYGHPEVHAPVAPAHA